jgi:RNA polymerase sigma factor (sigma-70 family)
MSVMMIAPYLDHSDTPVEGGRNAQLVRAAADGDDNAWRTMVAEHEAVLRTVTRSFRLDAEDAADVAQTTWMRLHEHIRTITEPDRVGSWLITTARRECIRLVARSGRTDSFENLDDALDMRDRPVVDVDACLLAEERSAEICDAVDQLPPTWRAVMGLLLVDPPMSYQQIADTLGVPVGSVGPTRGRCIKRLRQLISA